MNTEELSLIVAALAVVVGPIVAYKLGVRRFAHERELDDRADARSTLAKGALELGRMKTVMKDALTEFKEPIAGRGDWPADFRDYIAKLEAAKEALESASAAIRIRFSAEDAMVNEFHGACGSVTSIISIYWIARGDEFGGGSPNDPREDSREAWELSQKFDDHKAAYLAAAQEVVGVDLAAAGGSGRIKAS
jgi:hypothetical protein